MVNLTPELADEVQVLEAEKQLLLSSLQKIFKESQELTSKTVHAFQGQIARLPALESHCRDIIFRSIKANIKIPEQLSAERINVTRLQEDADTFIQAINKKYYSLLAVARQSDKGPTGPTVATPQVLRSEKDYVRLPKYEIPKFSGLLTEWSAFYSTFTVSIHNDPSLSAVRKFGYLLTVLSGEALCLVRTLELTAENYQVAWELLESRYKSEKRHIYYHFGGLLDLPEVKNSNHIPQLLTKLQEHKNALTALKIEPAAYAPLLVTVLTRKLSTFWKRKLDESRDDPQTYPTLDEVIKFLKVETSQALDNPATSTADVKIQGTSHKSPKVLLCSSCLSSPVSKDSQSTSAPSGLHTPATTPHTSRTASTSPARSSFSPAPQISSNHSTASDSSAGRGRTQGYQCGLCDGGHQTFRCPDMMDMAPDERLAATRKRNLCENCLGVHDLRECESRRNCFRCNLRHHTILCEAFSPEDSQQDRSSSTPPAKKVMVARSSATTVLLPTARVLLSVNGRSVVARALLDFCAEVSIITTRCAKFLHLQPSQNSSSVSGFSEAEVKVDGAVNVDVSTIQGQRISRNHQVLVCEKITECTPAFALTRNSQPMCIAATG